MFTTTKHHLPTWCLNYHGRPYMIRWHVCLNMPLVWWLWLIFFFLLFLSFLIFLFKISKQPFNLFSLKIWFLFFYYYLFYMKKIIKLDFFQFHPLNFLYIKFAPYYFDCYSSKEVRDLTLHWFFFPIRFRIHCFDCYFFSLWLIFWIDFFYSISSFNIKFVWN